MSSENLQDVPADVPTGQVEDNSYVSREGNKSEPLPVQSDADQVEDPIDEAKADTDEQLARDDAEAIDKSNIMNERTRHAGKKAGTYREPGDDEGIPVDDGTSSTDQMK